MKNKHIIETTTKDKIKPQQKKEKKSGAGNKPKGENNNKV